MTHGRTGERTDERTQILKSPTTSSRDQKINKFKNDPFWRKLTQIWPKFGYIFHVKYASPSFCPIKLYKYKLFYFPHFFSLLVSRRSRWRPRDSRPYVRPCVRHAVALKPFITFF